MMSGDDEMREYCPLSRNQYLVRDRFSGLVFCEECGCVQESLRNTSHQRVRHIWEVNDQWPAYESFEDLTRQISSRDEIDLPSCVLVPNTPSLLLTYALERLASRTTVVH